MLKNAFWLFCFATLILFFFLPSFSVMQDHRQKSIENDRKIVGLKEKNKKLEEERRLLEEDPVYLERVAREKMGLVREGETIYRLTPEEKQK